MVATDLETSLLEELDLPNLEVRRHDLLADAPLDDEFDLVHSRFLLCHLPERDEALGRLVAAARPGGWIVVGDADFRGFRPAEPNEALERIWAGVLAEFERAGIEIGYGSRLPEHLESHGVESVEAEVVNRYTHGGSLASRLYGPTIERLRPQMIESGTATAAEVDEAIAMVNDPAFAHWTSTHVTASGLRPARDV